MELNSIVKRSLTRTETEILNALVGSPRGVEIERLLQHTTAGALSVHLSNVRHALVDGYGIRKRLNRYYLTSPVDTKPNSVETIARIACNTVVEPDTTDPLSVIRQRLEAKLDALESNLSAMLPRYERLADDITAAQLRIDVISTALRALDSDFLDAMCE